MSSKKDKNGWIRGIVELAKKEVKTDFGRVNLAFLALLIIFCVVYATRGPIVEIGLLISNTIKSCVLKQDIHHTYEEVGIEGVLYPILALMVLCLGYIGIHESRKKKIENKNTNK